MSASPPHNVFSPPPPPFGSGRSRRSREARRPSANDELLQQLRRYVAGEIDEDLLLPYILASARVVAWDSMKRLPPSAVYDEVTATLYQRTATMMRKINRDMDPLQIQQWIYRNFQGAVADAGREADVLSKRKRAQVNRWKDLCEEFTRQNGRAPTMSEQEALARQVVPKRMLSSNGRAEVGMIIQNPSSVPMDDLASQAAPGSEDDELDRIETEERTDALHLAAFHLEDDKLYAAFVKLVTKGRSTEGSIRPDLAASLRDALLELGAA